jgi:hypothetical protein
MSQVSMVSYAEFITQEKAKALGDTRSLGELRSAAKSGGKCEVCGEPVWRYGGCAGCRRGGMWD